MNPYSYEIMVTPGNFVEILVYSLVLTESCYLRKNIQKIHLVEEKHGGAHRQKLSREANT